MFFLLKFHPPGDAAIGFEQPSYTVVEGSGPVEVCVEISGLPAGGLGCDVTVNLTLRPGPLAGVYLYICGKEKRVMV